MASHENYWNMNIHFCQQSLKIEPIYPRKPHIKYEATRRIGPLALQEFWRRTERLNLQSNRLQKILESTAERRVVVHDEDHRFCCDVLHHSCPQTR